MSAANLSANIAIEPQATHVVREWKHSAMLMSCRFDPLGRYVFGTSGDRSIQRWPIDGDDVTALEGHTSWVKSAGFSPDGATMFSVGYDGKLILWETAAERPRPLQIVDAHRGWVRTLAVHPSGQTIATGGND
ncbi:MAG: WD40 repeat domain-containing protein, partial [Planctomycetota bacterium]|nr:WD40 repeat domain-containing protein [Planctomycetota bacterium]